MHHRQIELFPKIAIYQWNVDITASTAVRHEPVCFLYFLRGLNYSIATLHYQNIVVSLDSRPAHFPFSGSENRIHFPFPCGITHTSIDHTCRAAHTNTHSHNRVHCDQCSFRQFSAFFPHLLERNAYFFFNDCFVSINTRRRRSGRIITPSAVHGLRPFSLPFLCAKNPPKKKMRTNRAEAERISIVCVCIERKSRCATETLFSRLNSQERVRNSWRGCHGQVSISRLHSHFRGGIDITSFQGVITNSSN